MKKDIARNTLITAAYVSMMTLFFFGGYALGTSRAKTTAAVSATPVPAVRAASTSARESAHYELVLENSELFLYKRTGTDSELLYSHPITESVFPREDLDELRGGVSFDTLKDAQSLLENFVS